MPPPAGHRLTKGYVTFELASPKTETILWPGIKAACAFSVSFFRKRWANAGHEWGPVNSAPPVTSSSWKRPVAAWSWSSGAGDGALNPLR
jgi:hypothetical protein